MRRRGCVCAHVLLIVSDCCFLCNWVDKVSALDSNQHVYKTAWKCWYWPLWHTCTSNSNFQAPQFPVFPQFQWITWHVKGESWVSNVKNGEKSMSSRLRNHVHLRGNRLMKTIPTYQACCDFFHLFTYPLSDCTEAVLEQTVLSCESLLWQY